MKKFTALHVSDLHLSRSREREQQLALCALYKDIADYRDAGHLIDAIFFTGDLVAKGDAQATPPTYIFDNFIQPLLAAASAPGARFYLVPRSRDQQAAGATGFSFFSTHERADAEQRAVYQNVHAVFHGRKYTGDAGSLMQALRTLFEGNAGTPEASVSGFEGYSVLEFKGAPAPRWNVTLRQYDNADQAFHVAARYTQDGKESCGLAEAVPLPVPVALYERFDRQLLSHATSGIAPKTLRAIFVEPPISNLSRQPEQGGVPSIQSRSLAELAANDSAVFFVGRDESGKTTLLNYLCLQANTPCVFQVDMRAVGKVTRAALLDAAARSRGGDFHPSAIAALLHRPGAMLCIDNLAPGQADALDVLAAFLAEFNSCKFCFTLGEGQEKALEASFLPMLACRTELVYLHSFSAAQVRQLAENWFGAALAAVGPRLDAMLRAMADAGMPQTPFLVSIALSLAERGRSLAAANRAEMIAAYTAALLETADDAACQSGFLVELAYHLFEAKKLSMHAAELEQFEADYFGVRGLGLPTLPIFSTLCERGILFDAGGAVSFQFDCLRTFYLAQKFDTSIDLMRYAFTQRGFVELQPELDIYAGLHKDHIEVLTATAPASEAPAQGGPAQAHGAGPGTYEERFLGGGRHSADLQESLILDVARRARISRRASLSGVVLSDSSL
ncbi:hypothetical protein [Janthinobacterium fluminis]|uniref:Calcineurin-like phosphoesterase domain-containing protein n=1 Tax=Janthinobacterium fluminis TaxID=2987524 RepID=A0ABT5K3H2_9BURK|nr:hypothetical protein [Janthinobacterium fluminis]MDC8759010.1 hypothetical protein [Janthinobacterium fluminis]